MKPNKVWDLKRTERERVDFNRLEKVGREKIEWRDLNKNLLK